MGKTQSTTYQVESRKFALRLGAALSLCLVVLLSSMVSVEAVENGEPRPGCVVKVGTKSSKITQQKWNLERIASLPSPLNVTICRYNNGAPYSLIITRFASVKEAERAVKTMYGENGFVYLGVPTTFSPLSKKPSTATSPIAGFVSSDDCGMYGGEIFDTGCPQGKAALVRVGKDIWVLGNRFELNGPQVTSAPTKALSSLLTLNKLKTK